MSGTGDALGLGSLHLISVAYRPRPLVQHVTQINSDEFSRQTKDRSRSDLAWTGLRRDLSAIGLHP